MSKTFINNSHDHRELINGVLNADFQLSVVRPATIKDGIRKLNKYPRQRYLKKFNKRATQRTFCNFIIASESDNGMFKDLLVFASNFNPDVETFSTFINNTKTYSLKKFFFDLKKFAFYSEIPERITNNPDFDSHDAKKLAIAQYIVNHLKPQDKPKALVKFHAVQNENFTALHQQYKLHLRLSEKIKLSQLVFAINSDFESAIQNETTQLSNNDDDVIFSYQSKKSISYCLDKYNNIYTLEDGKPLTKSSGHGALLENLNSIDSDVIHIHTIDNIPHDNLHLRLAREKKVMIGYLSFLEHHIHNYLIALENGKLKKRKFRNFKKFCKKHLHINFDSYLENSQSGLNTTIYKLLNRPIRVCAMVARDYDAVGRPFWVTDDGGQESLQIIESTELVNSGQNAEETGTHVNPVEVFCVIKDYKGQKFDLTEFADNNRKTLVNTSYDGNQIKFFKMAGLWNGGMHKWLTIFVDIDSGLFNPVKTVTDLLGKNHLE